MTTKLTRSGKDLLFAGLCNARGFEQRGESVRALFDEIRVTWDSTERMRVSYLFEGVPILDDIIHVPTGFRVGDQVRVLDIEGSQELRIEHV